MTNSEDTFTTKDAYTVTKFTGGIPVILLDKKEYSYERYEDAIDENVTYHCMIVTVRNLDTDDLVHANMSFLVTPGLDPAYEAIKEANGGTSGQLIFCCQQTIFVGKEEPFITASDFSLVRFEPYEDLTDDLPDDL